MCALALKERSPSPCRARGSQPGDNPHEHHTARCTLPPGQAPHPRRHDYARYAEEKGFEAVWQAESRLVRDAIVPMAAFAAVTERIQVGSGVINNWTPTSAS